MNEQRRIVLVEDDAAIAELIQYNLTNEGFEVKSFRNGALMFESLPGLRDICLFILDIMLPGMDGFSICQKIRENESFSIVPVIMLTARATESDKVRGLESGADDYVTKPFGIREFLARVNAQVRRYDKSLLLMSNSEMPSTDPDNEVSLMTALAPDVSSIRTGSSIIRCANITLDDVKHRVYASGVEIELTNREYELLKFLMTNRGVAYSRDDLLNHVWGYEYSGETRTVDVHIRQLRRKIERDDANPEIIETVRGRGYRFCEHKM
jgi:DNA-binding response OmpR family regulator